MNTGAVLTRWLRDTARPHAWWTLGLIAAVALLVAPHRALRANDALASSLGALPTDVTSALGLRDVLSETGYTHAAVFTLVGTLGVVLGAIVVGARAVAADEQRGYLELVLSRSVSRSTLLTARLLGVTALITVVCVAVGALALAAVMATGLSVTPMSLVLGTVSLWLLALLHAYLAFTLGATTGRVGVALLGTCAVLLLGFFAHTLGSRLAAWVPELSPFHWAFGQEALRADVDVRGLALLVTACVLVASLAWVGFGRRALRRP